MAQDPQVTDTYTQKDLTAMTELDDADACYYALFAGAKCETEGGVYKIEKEWYTIHPGGSFSSVRANRQGCGTVVEKWVTMGRHGTIQFALPHGKDFAVFLCPPPPLVPP
jgi:hypothetical protein